MARYRSRSRSRGRGPRWRVPSVLFVIAVVLLVTAVPTNAVNFGTADRSSSIDVVGDVDGVQKLNVTSELEDGTEGCLVEVTNHLSQDVTVNVSLREDSTSYGTLKASLIDSLASGDSVEFNLAAGDTQTVSMDVNSGTAGNTTYFHVNSTGPGIYAETLNRSAPIKTSATSSCA